MAEPLNTAAAPYLTAPQQALAVRLVQQHLPGHDVRVFGSRATGRRLKPWSDMDLLVMPGPGVTVAALQNLAQAFDDSDLPFRVDVLLWQDAPESWRASLQDTAVPLDAGADLIR